MNQSWLVLSVMMETWGEMVRQEGRGWQRGDRKGGGPGPRGDGASIAEITEEADIGFGSFYNHFDSKEQLFQTASEEVLERWGQLIDRATTDITDPAERFAAGTRISGRLGWTHPDIAGFLT